MPALEHIVGTTTAAGSSFSSVTMVGNDSLTIRHAPDDTRPLIVSAWADNQADGEDRLRSPFMHDNTQGLRVITKSGQLMPYLFPNFPQIVVPQDTLILEKTGSATAGDVESTSLLVYYPALPGVSARFITPEELRGRMLQYAVSKETITVSSASSYEGSTAVNNNLDQFHNNRDYALLGYRVDTECSAVTVKSADLGNLRIGGPGELQDTLKTEQWFVSLAAALSAPLVPVINSAQFGSTFIEVVQDENTANVDVTLIWGLLAQA